MRENGFITGLLYVLMVFLTVGLLVLVYFNYQANDEQMAKVAAEEAAAAVTPTPAPTATPEPTPTPTRNTETVTLAFAGDIVGQAGLTSDAEVQTQTTAEDTDSTDDTDTEQTQTTVSYDFSLELAGVADTLSGADLAACTLVGTLSSGEDYTAYHMPTSFAEAMVGAGFQLVNTATDHILDYELTGLQETVDALSGQGLAVVGAYGSELSHGIFVADVGDIKVALLSYTYGTNGVSVVSNPWCVDILTTDYMTDQTTVDYARIDADIAAAKEAGADVIACFVYWWDNTQYYTAARDNQTEVADYLCQNGVDILIGGGVKTPQPIEVRTVERADGTKANCVVCYSLSNLMSCFNDNYTNLAATARIEVSRDTDTGEVWVSGVSYEPLFMLDTDDYGDYLDPGFKYRILDAYGALEGYENQTDGGVVSANAYAAIQTGITDLQTILGADYDAVNGGVRIDYPY